MSTMVSQIPASRLLVQPFVQAHMNEYIKAQRHWPFYGGNSPLTGEYPVQRAINAETVSIWWRHLDIVSFFSANLITMQFVDISFELAAIIAIIVSFDRISVKCSFLPKL